MIGPCPPVRRRACVGLRRGLRCTRRAVSQGVGLCCEERGGQMRILCSRRVALALGLVATLALVVTLAASANVALTQIATDPFTNTTSQHRTIVEPDTFSFGSTIVATAQLGRFFDGGSSDIGYGTSK